MNRIGTAVAVASIGHGVFIAPTTASASTATFNTGLEGWVAVDINPYAHISADPFTSNAVWDPLNGLPAGSLRTEDVFGWTWIAAPPSWLGNRGWSFGLIITWDLLIRWNDQTEYPAIALRGRNMTLYFNDQVPTGTWTHMEVPLLGSFWRVNDCLAGPVATDQQLQQVLRDLRGIYINAEWYTGPDDTNIDNIEFTGFIYDVCVGDVNLDGFTNVADFNLLAGHFGGAVVPYTNGDLTGDGLVNISDFNVLAGDFGCN